MIKTEDKAFNEISKIIGINLVEFDEILGCSNYFDESFSAIFNTKHEIVFEEFEKEIEEIYVDILKIFDIQKILFFAHKNSAMGSDNDI